MNLTTSGTGLVQPLTQLLKVRAGNDVARAEVNATRGKARGVENEIALTVHQLYYKILIAEVRFRPKSKRRMICRASEFNKSSMEACWTRSSLKAAPSRSSQNRSS